MTERLLALILGITVTAFLLWRRLHFWRGQFAYEPSRVPNYRSFQDYLRDSHSAADDDSVPDLLLAQVTALYKELDDNTKAMDAKANTLLGFVGGGVSVYAVAVESKFSPSAHATWLILLAACLFLLTLLFSLFALASQKRRGLDVLRDFANDQIIGRSDTTQANVNAFLFTRMLLRFDRLRTTNIRKAAWSEAAQQSFGAGVLAIVINFFLGDLNVPSSGAAKVECVKTSNIGRHLTVDLLPPLDH